MDLGTFSSARQTTLAWRAALLADPCVYCGEKATCVDHIAASAMGGEAGWENMTSCCHPCNSRKGSKTMLAFLSGEKVGHDNWSRQWERHRVQWAREKGYLHNLVVDYVPW